MTERALEIRTASDAVPDDKARMLAGLAWVQQRRGRSEEAEPLYRKALARLDEIEPDPSLEDSGLPHRALRARIHARLGHLQLEIFVQGVLQLGLEPVGAVVFLARILHIARSTIPWVPHSA